MTEILETANKLVKQHGERAPDVAAERAIELEQAGDGDSGTYWQSVMIQTKVLLARDNRL
jgi:hypothetical protein